MKKLIKNFIKWYNKEESIYTILSNKEKVWFIIFVIIMVILANTNIWV